MESIYNATISVGYDELWTSKNLMPNPSSIYFEAEEQMESEHVKQGEKCDRFLILHGYAVFIFLNI